MKKALLITILSIISIGVFAQEREERKLSSFDKIKSSQAIDVYIKPGSEEKVVVVVDRIDLDDVLTEVSGGKLSIRLSKGNYRNIDVKVYVTYKNLNGVSASSASNITGEGTLKTDRLKIGVSSAASIELRIDCEDLNVSASSSGDMELEGRARSIYAKASSAGEIDAYDLVAENADLGASSAGDIRLTVNKSIDAHASSGGSIRYKGNPDKSNTNSSSGGSVKKH